MSIQPPFYHVDRLGLLSVGDELNLTWDPSSWEDNQTATWDTPHENRLWVEFPGGLSKHGFSYAHSYHEIEKIRMCYKDPQERINALQQYLSDIRGNVFHEWAAEKARREMRNENSRFQRFFAWPTVDSIADFAEGDEAEAVCIVEPTDYEILDMNIITEGGDMQPREMVERSKRYWQGDTLNNAPEWEVLMKPPVEICEVHDPNQYF